jgi:hypothetical protein
VIDVLRRGNQELFHSAFLAWLMNDHENHGLGKSFRSRIISQVQKDFGYDPQGEYNVETEHSEKRLRFDILLTPKGSEKNCKGLVFENKVKSFGLPIQLDKYERAGYNVVALALLPQTLSEEIRQQVLTYKTILDALHDVPLRSEHPYQFLVIQYRSFLQTTLDTYAAITAYCEGKLESDAFFERLGRAVNGLAFRDNDIRTFSHFYNYGLAKFIKKSARDLVFGDCEHEDAAKRKENTRWFYEKNMQGGPFLDALIYQPFDTPGWKLHSAFRAIHEKNPLKFRPRLEISLDLPSLVKEKEAPIGKLKLGTWSPEFIAMVKQTEPYSKTLKSKSKAKVNFECQCVYVHDLPFHLMVERIRETMRLIFEPRFGNNLSP